MAASERERGEGGADTRPAHGGSIANGEGGRAK